MISSLSSVSAIDFPIITEKNIYDSDVVKVKSKNLSYVVVNLNEKIKFSASTKDTSNINWNFGDNSKIIKKKTINQVSTVTHTFKKVGSYNVKVDIEGSNGINLINTDFITVKVVKKPDLVLTKLNYVRKGKDVVSVAATVKNKGTISSKACYMKLWYKDKKINKYTKTAKIQALKPGKSSTAIINFQIPYKYRNHIKYVKVDSTNKITESIKSNNQKTFK